MRDKEKSTEELVSYKSLGKFVREKRQSLGYNSAGKLAEANPGVVTESYIKHIEAADGMFGSPETFLGLAKALGVNPGLMMDILVEYRDFDGNPLTTENTLTLPDNFTAEDRQLLSELISFLGYRKQLNIKQARAKQDRRDIDFKGGTGAVEGDAPAGNINPESNPEEEQTS